MLKTDYKFHYVKRWIQQDADAGLCSQDQVGEILEAAIHFYEGDVTTELENVGVPPVPTQVTRYRRTKKLTPDELKHLKSKKVKRDFSGQDFILYEPEDFGRIKTDAELRAFLNQELAKDVSRTPIDEQKNA